MSLSIKDPKADKLARELAQETGQTITQAVIKALDDQLKRIKQKHNYRENLANELMDIGRHCANLPILDYRSPNEILNYNENGLPN